MSDMKLGLFNGEDKPDVLTVWNYYQNGLKFNQSFGLDETVKANENFFIGKQWEGVQANGLPTPVFNILKRVVGFIVATITTDNLKVNVSAMANSLNTDSYQELVRVVSEEFDAIMEFNNVPKMVRQLARNAAVDGDGCVYTYWDPTVNMGNGVMGAIRYEILQNTRVFFGNPNDRNVQSQPYIQIVSRELLRNARLAAKRNGSKDWDQIMPDTLDVDDTNDAIQDDDDKVTVLLTLWRDDQTGEIWGYESTHNVEIKKPWSLGIRKYPLVWMNWDYIQDSYHGQSMITGLIPNQIFINKAFAMAMLSMMRTAWPKIVFDKTRISKWDNRVGGAIGVNGGIHDVATVIDPAQISPQIAQFIQMAIEETEETLGATASALGEGKAYNTSAILSLQRAAATPTEMIKQNLYQCIEDQRYIDLEFMGNYYGVREVDMATPPEIQAMYAFVDQQAPETIPQEFDFTVIKDQPFLLKLDVGASSYYSEIAAMQTLDNLLQSGQINIVQYLERVPDSYVPGRMKLVSELRQQMEQQKMMEAMMTGMPPEMAGMGTEQPPQAGMAQSAGTDELEPIAGALKQEPEITGGRGYRAAAREINGNA